MDYDAFAMMLAEIEQASVVMRLQRQRRNIEAMKEIFSLQHVSGFWKPSAEPFLSSFFADEQHVQACVVDDIAAVVSDTSLH